MNKNWLFLPVISLLCGTCAAAPSNNVSKGKNVCGEAPHPVRFSVRHIEGGGIGYNDGYTTLEGFFAPPEPWKEVWLPFVDVRGHLFNNGKPAANGGIGLRYLGSRVWGANFYYDYRKTRHQNYQQVSLGFESLGETWDFRINGYLPVGDKKSSFFNTRFDHFKDHYAVLSHKYEFAMKGVNAEVGAHVDNLKHTPFYFAAGPYYLEGQGKIAWGGKARATLDIWEYARIEGSLSYDNIFQWVGQGQLSLTIPLGRKREIKQRGSRSCSQSLTLASRSLQRVDRSEIIPTDHKRETFIAKNPATNTPYFFWFVNNLSHSAGTFESPFPALSSAIQASKNGDIIYVYPGDGTTTGLNAFDTPFELKDNQQLLGAGVSHILPTQKGNIAIPAQASGTPYLIANAENSVVVLANGNTVSGLHIGVDANATLSSCIGNPFDGPGISNVMITNNLLEAQGSHAVCIDIEKGSGTILIANNTFQGPVSSSSVIFIFTDSATSGSNIFIINNDISDFVNNFGIDIESQSNDNCHIARNNINNCYSGININNDLETLNCTIASNTITNCASNGLQLAPSGGGEVNFTITSNQISSNDTGISAFSNASATARYSITSNTIDAINGGAQITSADSSTTCLRFQNNQETVGNSFIQQDSSTFNLEPYTGNNQTYTPSGTITPVSQNACGN